MDDQNNNEEINKSEQDGQINFQLVNENREDSFSPYFVNRPDYERKKKRNKKRSLFSYFIVALVAALIGGTVSAYIAPVYLYGKIIPLPEIYKSPNVGEKINITTSEDINTVSAVAKKSMKSVVGITTVETVRDFIWERQVQGVGSGVIVDARGYILTNSHVVGDNKADRITVLFENGDKKVGRVLWHDPNLDLAIVKVDTTNLPVADFGDSDVLQIGELAVAIGNPLGLEFQRTVTSGIISGLNRTIPIDQYNKMEDLIQTDASINPGNSGGPLLNAKGEVIGINTAKISTGEGLGFAIPINVAKPIVEQLIKDGKFVPVYIGIQGTDVSRYEQALGIDLKADYGVYIAEIIPNSPASSSGLQPGDVLISIDGKKVESYKSLKKVLYHYKPEDKVKAVIMRNGENIEIDIVLKESSLTQ
ncbi:serine protease HtrA [Brassicibacter mesophilus]|uniref:serine protease HtrA n=1 Tax=Brassicibacter mesophilus TaxID=745119 RepID=UPI003D1B9ED9